MVKFLEPEHYQSKLTTLFEQLKEKLELSLPEARIEHIGSSSIKGAVSKGDLDIFISVDQTRFDSSLEKIEALGFKIKQDTLRTESLCMLETKEFDVDVAIQLVVAGSSFENFLTFRDRLNQSPSLVAEYNCLKRESENLSHEAYREKKSKFISRVLAETKK